MGKLQINWIDSRHFSLASSCFFSSLGGIFLWMLKKKIMSYALLHFIYRINKKRAELLSWPQIMVKYTECCHFECGFAINPSQRHSWEKHSRNWWFKTRFSQALYIIFLFPLNLCLQWKTWRLKIQAFLDYFAFFLKDHLKNDKCFSFNSHRLNAIRSINKKTWLLNLKSFLVNVRFIP